MSTIAAHPVQPDTKSTSRRRGVLGVVAIALLALALAGCMPADAQTFLDRTNSLRRTAGRPRRSRSTTPSPSKAEAWAQAHGRHRPPRALDAQRGPRQPGAGRPWVRTSATPRPPATRCSRIHNMFVSSAGHRAQHGQPELHPHGRGRGEGQRRTHLGGRGVRPPLARRVRGRPRRHARLRPWPVAVPTCCSWSPTRSGSARGCRRRCGCRGGSA